MDGKTAEEGTKEIRHGKSWRLKIREKLWIRSRHRPLKPTQLSADTTTQIDVNIMKSFKNFNIEISF